jgi:squalene synthase HpnC
MIRDRTGGGTMLGQQPARPESAVTPAGAVAAKAAAENFPVALRMLPRRYRDHLMAVYVYARTVDDVGDEAPPDQRLSLLAGLREDLERLYAGPAATPPGDPAVRGLASVVEDCAIPMRPFRDLIAANEQDQVVFRYQTFDDLLGYCELSANPVGQIVLYVFGCHTPERAGLSDAVCSALQVIEHLQDVAEDYRAGRIYLPLDDLHRHGCSERDLAGQVASPQLRGLIAAEAGRAAELLAAGAPLVGQLRGAARLAVAGYLAGGRAALAALARARYDVLAVTPRPSKGRMAAAAASALVRGR